MKTYKNNFWDTFRVVSALSIIIKFGGVDLHRNCLTSKMKYVLQMFHNNYNYIIMLRYISIYNHNYKLTWTNLIILLFNIESVFFAVCQFSIPFLDVIHMPKVYSNKTNFWQHWYILSVILINIFCQIWNKLRYKLLNLEVFDLLMPHIKYTICVQK